MYDVSVKFNNIYFLTFIFSIELQLKHSAIIQSEHISNSYLQMKSLLHFTRMQFSKFTSVILERCGLKINPPALKSLSQAALAGNGVFSSIKSLRSKGHLV